MPSGLAGFKPSQSRLVNHPATIWRIDRGGKLDVHFGGLVDAHRGISQRVVQYVTSLQSLIGGEVQMEADELDSRQAVRELQNPTIVPDIGGAIALRAVLLEDAAFANLLLFDAVTGSDWDRGLFALMLKHTEVFEALPQLEALGLELLEVRCPPSRTVRSSV